jgi:HEAT repeat protein
MDANTSENPLTSPDTGLLTTIIHEFTVAYRYVSSYPKGHPTVTSSCERVVELFRRLFDSRDELTMGVAKDSLVIDGHSLDRLTPFARHFAKSLFYHRVALVTFQKGLTAEEVEKFNYIMTVKREQIAALGGIEAVFREAGLPNLRIKEIRYDAFHVTGDISAGGERDGDAPSSLWDAFVRELLRDSLPSSLTPSAPDAVSGPESLFSILCDQLPHDQLRAMERLAFFLQKEVRREALTNREMESFGRIVDFISSLTPVLRKHFLHCVLSTLEGDTDPALEILSHLPREVILEAVQLCNEKNDAPPPLLLSIVEKLSEDSLTGQERVRRADEEEGEPLPGQEQKLDIIFRETSGDEFIPIDYLETLKALIASRDIPAPDEGDLAELKQTLSGDCIEVAVSGIILESFQHAAEGQLDVLKRNLLDLCRYFLEVGDFLSLENVYDRLQKTRFETGQAAHSLKREMLETFEGTEFIDEVLNGLDIWGRKKFHEIGALIHTVGRPFVEPLLDRLAEEENRTIRRYCLDQLQKLAEVARESVLARMDDTRWYVIRNLLIILLHSRDPDLATHLRRVADHPHPKVRQKVIEMYLQLRDPEGDRLLLDDLASDTSIVRLQAIQQAEKSVHPEIVAALLEILLRKGSSPESFAEKKAAIRSLAEIGDPRAIPVLEKILKKRAFLRFSLHMSLKKEVVQTLGRYREPSAVALLSRMAESRNPELSALASAQCRRSGRDEE